MKIISAKNISKSFDKLNVLRDVSFEVNQGEILGLLGPSGAGKTTLIKILTGQLAATSGEAFLLDKKSEQITMSDRKSIGIMMDEFGLYERLSCYDNLKIFADLHDIKRDTIRNTLKEVGLAEFEKTAAEKMSKGMKSRLRLARAFLINPTVLFLDEPTSGLDPATREAIHTMILDRKKQGCTIFLTTHNMTEAEILCDRIALLNNGCIIESGSPEEVCRRYDHLKQINMHLSNGNDISLPSAPESAQKIYEALADGSLLTIHSSEPSLEDVFMELTGNKLDR